MKLIQENSNNFLQIKNHSNWVKKSGKKMSAAGSADTSNGKHVKNTKNKSIEGASKWRTILLTDKSVASGRSRKITLRLRREIFWWKKKKKIQIFHAPSSGGLFKFGRWKRQPIGCWPFSLSFVRRRSRRRLSRRRIALRRPLERRASNLLDGSCHRSATVRRNRFVLWLNFYNFFLEF